MNCRVIDCTAPVHAKEYCASHYRRLRIYGNALKRLRSDPNEILDRGEYAEVVLYDMSGEEVGRALIDLADVNKVKRYKWHFSGNYVEAKVDGVKVSLHRFLLDFPNFFVDHRNGIETDNRRSNLRVCDKQQNVFNSRMPRNNTSGYRGVTWHKHQKKWMAAIQVNRKCIHLGYFDSKKEAHQARLKAEVKYFGEFSPYVSRDENRYAVNS